MSDDTAAPMLVSRLFDGTRYRVPMYQRAFAWGADEIEALFTDIRDVSSYSPTGHYYIGVVDFLQQLRQDRGRMLEVGVDRSQDLTGCKLPSANHGPRQSVFSAAPREAQLRIVEREPRDFVSGPIRTPVIDDDHFIIVDQRRVEDFANRT